MKRIQRKRNKGWVSPDNTLYIGRPTMYGNPFNVETRRHRICCSFGAQQQVVDQFVKWLAGELDNKFPDLVKRKIKLLTNLHELKGKNLSCWCDEGTPCHGDVLIEMANR